MIEVTAADETSKVNHVVKDTEELQLHMKWVMGQVEMT